MINTKEIEPLSEATTVLEEEGARVTKTFSANCENLINFFLLCKKTRKLVACIAVCRCRLVSALCCIPPRNSRKIISSQI